MIPQRSLGIAIIVWSLITWGGRIGLLTGDETTDPMVWFRIVGSLVTAALAGLALIGDRRWVMLAVVGYSLVALGVWGTSIVAVLPDMTASLQFKMIHTVLAGVSLVLAGLALRMAFSRLGSADSSR